jgi:protein tyrosine/serine phosphatase
MWRSQALVAMTVVLALGCATAPRRADGLPPNFGVVEEGHIYRGGQPTAAELEALAKRGVKTIVKVNTKQTPEEHAAAARLGMKVVQVPLNAHTVGNAAACPDVERAYAAMTDPANQPVFVHCDHGRDRTGFLVGLYRERAEGWTFEEVERELAEYGHDAKRRLVFPNITRTLAAPAEAAGCAVPALPAR